MDVRDINWLPEGLGTRLGTSSFTQHHPVNWATQVRATFSILIEEQFAKVKCRRDGNFCSSIFWGNS